MTALESSVQLAVASTREFVNREVLPFEVMLARTDAPAEDKLTALRASARQQGFWGRYFPISWGGQFPSLDQYLAIGYEEGRSEFAAAIFGGLATVDAHMLDCYGSSFVKSEFLAALSCGEMTSAYAMTEPDRPGSIPASLGCLATRRGDSWLINGRKWFVCNANHADYISILACTDPESSLAKRLTMFVVPANLDGCRMVGEIPVFGRRLGQGEYVFTNLQVHDRYRLGDVGQGTEIMLHRVGLGRLMRSIHWLGLAGRCLELSYQRIHSSKGKLTRLAEKQLIRAHIFDSYAAIESGKLLLSKAAKQFDRGVLDQNLASLVKVQASKALCQAADSAVQIYGAEGVSDRTPLAGIYQVARTTRILDGADEALMNSVGASLIANNKTITSLQVEASHLNS